MLIETFGQKPPTGPGPFNYEYSTPAVGLTGLAIAPDNGIVLTGYAADHVTGQCSPSLPAGATNRSFLARLREDGSLDASFGNAGVLTSWELERLTPPALTPTGRIAFEGASDGYCGVRGGEERGRIVSLLADGQFDLGFGAGGGVGHPQLGVDAVAFDRRGRLLALVYRHDSIEFGEDPSPPGSGGCFRTAARTRASGVAAGPPRRFRPTRSCRTSPSTAVTASFSPGRRARTAPPASC